MGEQILAALSPEEILARVPLKQRPAGLAPERHLVRLDRATIEAYRQQQEAEATKPTPKAPTPRAKAKKRPTTIG